MSRDGYQFKKALVPSILPMSSQTSRAKLPPGDFVRRQLSAPDVPTYKGTFKQQKKKISKEQTAALQKGSDRNLFSNRGSVQLEEELTLSQLKKLMRLFKTHQPEQRQRSGLHFFLPKSYTTEQPGQMNLKDFSHALGRALHLDQDVLVDQVEELFRKVDVSSDGLVDWDELCSYILMRLREKDCARLSHCNKVLNEPPKIVRIERSKEPTSRILTVFNPTRYITVSKDGIIRVWNMNLALQRSIIMEEDDNSIIQRSFVKRHMKMWVTDAVVMDNVHKMAICTTNMDIYFYDMSTPVFTSQFHLCGLGAVTFSMDYYYDEKNPSGKSLLFYGDDKGYVYMFIFHKPLEGLFETPFKKTAGNHIIFLQDLSSHANLVSHVTLDQAAHSDWVRKLRYFSSSDTLISCSGNSEDSLVVRSVLDKALEKTYIYKIPKGIDCFDYSKDLNLIATGGMDHVLRLWNSYVTIKPVALLKGHLARVIDVVLHKDMAKVFSYDSDTVLKIWDVRDHYCIQSVHLKYPYNLHHLEHGPFPVVFLPPPTNSLLIACEDYLTELKLDEDLNAKQHQTTHEKPLCAVLYNAHKKQVVTGCEGSIVRTWNLENGKKVFEFVGVLEKKDEMSCMALEKNGGRLFTGSRNGMVYVWTAGNGNLLHKCTPELGFECEVSAIQTLPEKSYTLSVGWSRRIIMYHDIAEAHTIPADPSWKGGHLHEDDILCIAHCPPNFVATGSFNGDLILWGLERQNVYRRLKRASGSLFKSKIKRIGLTSSRKRQKTENKNGVPIDALLFLEARAQAKEQDSAILVSSQAGVLEFWGMSGHLKPKGSFYAPVERGAIVLALTTNCDNSLLVSGDSSGYITIWDIREYCIAKPEASVAEMRGPSKRHVFSDSKDITPSKKCHWQAHSKSVVSLEMVNQSDRGQLILSASGDCTAKLWTDQCHFIGMFGQAQPWDLKNVHATSPKAVRFVNSDSVSSEKVSNSAHNITVRKTNKFDVEDVVKTNGKRPQTCGAFDLCESEKINRQTAAKCPESLGLNRSLTEWSILGERCNKTFERRMVDRRTRRDHLGHVDASRTKGCGSLSSTCSPFQALHVLAADEYELPRDLPMTPRMLSTTKTSPEENWQKNLSTLNLPPITLKDSETCE